MASVLVRADKTASNRAQLLGRLDRLGRGAEALTETDDELIALIPDYTGTEEDARAHFGEDADIEFHGAGSRVPKAGESEDFEPFVEVDGEVISKPASSREGPQAPPEYQADAAPPVADEHAPDTATEPSPGLSGAARSQAIADKRRVADDASPADAKPAEPIAAEADAKPRANRAADSKAKK